MKRLRATIKKNGPLTAKEAEVLRYLCEGYYRPEIALMLHRSLSVVNRHVEHIAEKLQATGITEITHIALDMGLVEINVLQPGCTTLCSFVIWYLIVVQIFIPSARRPQRAPRPISMRLVRSSIREA